uniref:Uncharacterized protein n=1 Tax=Anguilla anguilla TaxID=7936 RepID=A0A0E9VKH2_ANGAN
MDTEEKSYFMGSFNCVCQCVINNVYNASF